MPDKITQPVQTISALDAAKNEFEKLKQDSLVKIATKILKQTQTVKREDLKK